MHSNASSEAAATPVVVGMPNVAQLRDVPQLHDASYAGFQTSLGRRHANLSRATRPRRSHVSTRRMPDWFEELGEFLRIPSISSEPAHAAPIAATFLRVTASIRLGERELDRWPLYRRRGHDAQTSASGVDR